MVLALLLCVKYGARSSPVYADLGVCIFMHCCSSVPVHALLLCAESDVLVGLVHREVGS